MITLVVCEKCGRVKRFNEWHKLSAEDSNKIRTMFANGEINFDFVICGHFHDAGVLNYNGKLVFRNGSIMPANDYAERLARSDPPRQVIFGVSQKSLPTFISFLEWTV